MLTLNQMKNVIQQLYSTVSAASSQTDFSIWSLMMTKGSIQSHLTILTNKKYSLFKKHKLGENYLIA